MNPPDRTAGTTQSQVGELAPPLPAVPPTPVEPACPPTAGPTGHHSWTIACRDAVDRERHLRVTQLPDGRWAITVPPGESAELSPIGLRVLRDLLDARTGGHHA